MLYNIRNFLFCILFNLAEWVNPDKIKIDDPEEYAKNSFRIWATGKVYRLENKDPKKNANPFYNVVRLRTLVHNDPKIDGNDEVWEVDRNYAFTDHQMRTASMRAGANREDIPDDIYHAALQSDTVYEDEE